MSCWGSTTFNKQYSRQECAFNLKDPERSGRPTPDHHCTQRSTAHYTVESEMNVKGHAPDPRTLDGATAVPTPLGTLQPGGARPGSMIGCALITTRR